MHKEVIIDACQGVNKEEFVQGAFSQMERAEGDFIVGADPGRPRRLLGLVKLVVGLLTGPNTLRRKLTLHRCGGRRG